MKTHLELIEETKLRGREININPDFQKWADCMRVKDIAPSLERAWAQGRLQGQYEGLTMSEEYYKSIEGLK